MIIPILPVRLVLPSLQAPLVLQAVVLVRLVALVAVRNTQLIAQITTLRIQSGVPQKPISRMENGLSFPAIKTLYTLVETLGHALTFQIET